MPLRKYRRPAIEKILIWGVLLLLSEFLLIGYDRWFANNDGFIGHYHIQNLFQYVWVFFFVVSAIFWGISSPFRFVQNIASVLASLCVTWGLLEVVFYLVFKFGLLKSDKPLHRRILFDDSPHTLTSGDFSAHFGRWSMPNDSALRPRPSGDSIWLRYNAFGARDKQRSIQNLNKKKRIVVVGDSFIEGYMLDTAQRFGNLLENKTGYEHLNFGINGTGLLDYFLRYQFLAKTFEHDVVLVGILPANDFSNYNEKQRLSLFDYPIYRPYWHPKTTGGYQLKYSLADISQSIASSKTRIEPRNTLYTVDSLYKTLKWYEKPFVAFNQNSYLYQGILACAAKINRPTDGKSIFESCSKDNFGLLAYFLEQLRLETQGKKVIVLVFPIEDDLKNYDTKQDIFNPELGRLCKKNGFGLIDLLPYFNEYKDPKANLYTQGDGHWNAKGDSLVASVLFNHPVYRAALGIKIDPKKKND